MGYLPRRYHRRICAGAAGAARSWRFCSWGPPRALLSRWGTPRTKRLEVAGSGPLSWLPAHPPNHSMACRAPPPKGHTVCPSPQPRPDPPVSLRQKPCAADAHHTVGVTAVTLHTMLHQLLLIQIAGSAVGASKGGPIGNIAGGGRTLSEARAESTQPNSS